MDCMGYREVIWKWYSRENTSANNGQWICPMDLEMDFDKLSKNVCSTFFNQMKRQDLCPDIINKMVVSLKVVTTIYWYTLQR